MIGSCWPIVMAVGIRGGEMGSTVMAGEIEAGESVRLSKNGQPSNCEHATATNGGLSSGVFKIVRSIGPRKIERTLCSEVVGASCSRRIVRAQADLAQWSKPVEVFQTHHRTRVRFPPPPPIFMSAASWRTQQMTTRSHQISRGNLARTRQFNNGGKS